MPKKKERPSPFHPCVAARAAETPPIAFPTPPTPPVSHASQVQTGFGRCGDFWGFTGEDVVPDIITLGKPMGNGFPIGGVICRTELAEAIEDAKLFSTFGGNPPAAAAGLAVLQAIDDDKLVQRAAAMGARLRRGLQGVVERHPALLTHVSGRGLFLGLHLRAPADGAAHPHVPGVLEACRERGLVIGKGGRQGQVLRWVGVCGVGCLEAGEVGAAG